MGEGVESEREREKTERRTTYVNRGKKVYVPALTLILPLFCVPVACLRTEGFSTARRLMLPSSNTTRMQCVPHTKLCVCREIKDEIPVRSLMDVREIFGAARWRPFYFPLWLQIKGAVAQWDDDRLISRLISIIHYITIFRSIFLARTIDLFEKINDCKHETFWGFAKK